MNSLEKIIEVSGVKADKVSLEESQVLPRRQADRDQNGLIANLAVSLIFFILGLNRLGLPEILYFDETWYVVSAARLLNYSEVLNREHPMFGKEMIALFYWMFGGSWVSARIGSLIFGTLGLFAFQRTIFIVSQSRSASIFFGLLISTNCLYFVSSRTALLDPFMLGLIGVALYFYAKAICVDRRKHLNFLLAGSFIGLALASKWTAAPVALIMAIFAVARFWRQPIMLLTYGTLAVLAAVILYSLTFLPLLSASEDRLTLSDLIPLQRAMAFHLSILIREHPYQSDWWDWPIGLGQMWIFVGKDYGIDRVVIFAQNPVSTLLSLPAVIYAIVRGIPKRDLAIVAPAFAYCVCMAFWMVTHKPNMYLYHYNLPSIFALAIVAQLMARSTGNLKISATALALVSQLIAFAYFYPVMSAADLKGRLVQKTDYYGWAENPDATRIRRPVGNAKELGLWARRCVAAPSRPECSKWRRNTVDR